MTVDSCRELALFLAWQAASDLRRYWYEFAEASLDERTPEDSWLAYPCLALNLRWPPSATPTLREKAQDLVSNCPKNRGMDEMGLPAAAAWEGREKMAAYVLAAPVESFLGLPSFARALGSCTSWKAEEDADQMSEAEVIEDILEHRLKRDLELVQLVCDRMLKDESLVPLAVRILRLLRHRTATEWLKGRRAEMSTWPEFVREELAVTFGTWE